MRDRVVDPQGNEAAADNAAYPLIIPLADIGSKGPDRTDRTDRTRRSTNHDMIKIGLIRPVSLIVLPAETMMFSDEKYE